MEYYATCPTGFERLLAQELKDLGIEQVRPLQGQVSFGGDVTSAYRTCLWSRLASRVIAVISRGGASTADELYETVSGIGWEEHLGLGSTLAISASGTNSQLKNTQYTALRVKDAIVDRVAAKTGTRLVTNPKSPDVTVVARVSNQRVMLGIDLAGSPLFRRGYERANAMRGLRPDYAAALLTLGGWRVGANSPDRFLIDASPLSSTVLVEAALMAARRAPGLLRVRWGFDHWLAHDPSAWRTLVDEADALAAQDVASALVAAPPSGRTTDAIRAMIRSAGTDAEVRPMPKGLPHEAGLVVCDLSDLGPDEVAQEAEALSHLASTVRTASAGAIVCASRDMLASSALGRQPRSTEKSMLGRDPLFLCAYDGTEAAAAQHEVTLGDGGRVPVLVPASDQFAARLRKTARLRAKWARREDVTCYRVYDADLPDYALTIDLFQGTDPQTGELDGRRWLWVSEYAAPKDVDRDLARSRLMDALAIAPRVLDVGARNTFLRVRQHAKGGSQYASDGQRRAKGRTRKGAGVPLPPGAHLIDEGGLTFEVNFSTRLDCGIFLDHRDTRAMLREMAKQTQGSKRFLNLFAYTGTATCYAADGGMRHTTTVDLSRPSLDWARRNMERNGFDGPDHEYVQADVVRWVSEQRHTNHRWDLVFCDVPTFSNSSRMGRRSFDVQRDHAELLIGVSRLLTRNGSCVFSCNLRNFWVDAEKLAKAGVVVEDITAQTIPDDFARNQRVHHAFVVRRQPRPE